MKICHRQVCTKLLKSIGNGGDVKTTALEKISRLQGKFSLNINFRGDIKKKDSVEKIIHTLPINKLILF